MEQLCDALKHPQPGGPGMEWLRVLGWRARNRETVCGGDFCVTRRRRRRSGCVPARRLHALERRAGMKRLRALGRRPGDERLPAVSRRRAHTHSSGAAPGWSGRIWVT